MTTITTTSAATPRYAPAATIGRGASASTTSSTPTDGNIGTTGAVSISLSDDAKAVLATPHQPNDFASVGQDARTKLDADYAKARAEGSRAVTETSNGGRFVDMSGLSDQELAAVKLNKDRLFSQGESDMAWGVLGQRVKVSLEPWEGDLGKYQMGVQQLYKGMSSEVRQALGWNEAMIDMSKRLVAFSEKISGKIDQKSFLEQFIEHLKELQDSPKDRALTVNMSLMGFDDSSSSAASSARPETDGTSVTLDIRA